MIAADLIRAVFDDAPLAPEDEDRFDASAAGAAPTAPEPGQVRAGPSAMFALRGSRSPVASPAA